MPTIEKNLRVHGTTEINKLKTHAKTDLKKTTVRGLLKVHGDEIITRNLQVRKNETVIGDLAVKGEVTTKSLNLTNNLLIPKNLIVGGNETIAGDLAVTGILTSSNINVTNSLNVPGKLTVGGNETIAGDLSLGGNLAINGTLSTTNLNVTNSLNVPGNLTVGGNETITGDLALTGTFTTSNLNVTNNLNVPGNLTVGGNETINGDLALTGTLNANNISLTSDLVVPRNLLVSGNETIVGNLGINGTLTTNNLSILGNLILPGNLTATNINATGDATIANLLTAKNLNVTDLITSNNLNVSGAITGNVVGQSSLNVLKTGDSMTGNLTMLDGHSLQFQDGIGVNTIGLKAPTSVTSNYTLALPIAPPISNQFLVAETPTDLIWLTLNTATPPSITLTIYISINGSDVTGNGSFNFPFASLVKAANIANLLSTMVSPVTILIGSGIYNENNTVPIAFTADGITITGIASDSVTIRPIHLNVNLIATIVAIHITNITLQAVGSSTAIGISCSGSNNEASFIGIDFNSFAVGISFAGTNMNYALIDCEFIDNTIAISSNSVGVVCFDCDITGSLSNTPTGTGIAVTGTSSKFYNSGGKIILCNTGINITGGFFSGRTIIFERNTSAIICNNGSDLVLLATSFQPFSIVSSTLTNIQVSGPNTTAKISGCIFNANDVSPSINSTALQVTDSAVVSISGGNINKYQTAMIIGASGDSSSTQLIAEAVLVSNCTNDIIQNGSATIDLNASTLSSSKIAINDPTNVNMSFFDIDNNNELSIGSLSDRETHLIKAFISNNNNPNIEYHPLLYGAQSIGYFNPKANDSSLFVKSSKNTKVVAVTEDHTKITGLKLISDQSSDETAIRGWDIEKNASTAELAFQFQNNDTTDGKLIVVPYTLMQLDGFNNQVQIPNTSTQITFAGDTNLYRQSANILKTDGNFIIGDNITVDGNVIVGGLTANTTLTVNSSKQLISSTVTNTELSYLSGTASSVQTQLNSKISKTGDTMTGSLVLPDGNSSLPALTFVSQTATGLSATGNNLSLNTNGSARLTASSGGTITIPNLTTTGVVHNDASGDLTTSLIMTADIAPSLSLPDSNLSTITTAGKVSNSATTATNLNTINTIVERDGSGGFNAGTIIASLTGASSLNVLKAGDTMTGSLVLLAGSTSVPSLQFTGSTNTGLSASSNSLSLNTNGSPSLTVSPTGHITIPNLSTTGVVHNDSLGNLTTSLITNADIDTVAAIADTKLGTISTTGKVSNTATTATVANTPNTIVERDGSGNFSAGTITASLAGASSFNVLKVGDTMTGSLVLPDGTTSLPSLTFSSQTGTGLSAIGNILSLSTAGSERLKIGSTGIITIEGLSGSGILHNGVSGNISSSLIVNSDIDPTAAIADTKLATISTTGKVSNFATTATDANTNGAIVSRDGSGNFVANTITASLTGASSLNVLKNGDTMTGALTLPNSSTTSPALNFVSNLTTGLSATTPDTLSFLTAGVANLKIDNTGAITMKGLALGTAGVLHCDSSLGSITNSKIVNIDIDPTAAIVDTKLATIATALKVSNSATTATDANTNGAIVSRDVSGNFAANTITASVSGASSLNVLKSGDTMTGNLTLLAGLTSAPSLQFTGNSTNTGLFAASDNLSITTVGSERLKIGSTGIITIDGLSTNGVVHTNSSGVLSTSLITNTDIDSAAAIADTKLATISTTGKVSNFATTATNINTANAIVARDTSGNFFAGTITASVSGASSLNVLKSGDTMTGNLTLLAGSTSVPSLQFTGNSTNTGLFAASDNLSITTVGSERLKIGSTGIITIDGLSTNGVVHTNSSGVLSTSLITNADIDSAAAIDDTKLATIATALKVSNFATTATNINTGNAIVARDISGNFVANTITASLTGASSLNVLKSGDTMTGTLVLPSLTFTSQPTTGLSATSNNLSLNTNGSARLTVSSSGIVAIPNLSTAGVVHNNALGNLTTSLIMTGDIDPSLSLSDSNLATITTLGKVSNNATTATNANTPNKIVLRDLSGNFSAGIITASLTGASSLNVLKAGDTMTGTLVVPSLTFTSQPTTGLSASSNNLSFNTNGVARLTASSGGTITIPNMTTTGVVHNDVSGNLSTSLITNGDITASTITNGKLATTSSSGIAGSIVVLDGSGRTTANQITINSSPTISTDVATKQYVDTAVSSGLKPVGPVIVVSTSNIFSGATPTGTGTSPIIDSVSVVTGNRVLLTAETGSIMNGIWIVNTTNTSVWTRPTDFPNGGNAQGTYTFVQEGTLNANSSWVDSNPLLATIGTDSLTFVLFSIVTPITAANLGGGTGTIFINETGNFINLKTLDAGSYVSIANNTDTITLSASGSSSNTINTLVARDGSGNFTAGTVTANLTGTVTGAASLNVLKAGDTMTGDLIMAYNNDLIFQDSGSNQVSLKAPTTVTSNYTIALPPTAPTIGQVLQATSSSSTALTVWTPIGGVPATIETYYVSKGGNDSNDGSFGAPFLTILHALSVLNSAGQPAVIRVGSGTFIEDNSSPLPVTTLGTSIIGNSMLNTIITPSTLSNDLFSCTTPSFLFQNLTIDAGGVGGSTANGIYFSSISAGTGRFESIAIYRFSFGLNLNSSTGLPIMLINNVQPRGNITSIQISGLRAIIKNSNFLGPYSGSTVSNTGINVTEDNALVTILSSSFRLLNTAITTSNNSNGRLIGSSIENTLNGVVMTTSSSKMSIIGCNFSINPVGAVNVFVSNSATMNIDGCYFDCLDSASAPQGTAVEVSVGGSIVFSGSAITNAITAIQCGATNNSDTSDTSLIAGAIVISSCTHDILQYGSSSLNFNTGTATASKISVHDPTNVKFSMFNPINNDALQIGSLTNIDTTLMNVLTSNSSTNPAINYVSSLYSTQAVGYQNSDSVDASWFVRTAGNANLDTITTTRANTSSLLIASDQTGLRGWDLLKNASTAELAFQFQNSDITDGKPTVSQYTLMQLDGFNNHVQLPNTSTLTPTQIILGGDTNLYRSAPNILKTDDNVIIGGLTANRALITDSSNMLTSSNVTNTELSYLSGTTSSVQTQITTKVSKTGDTMTGPLILSAGLTTAPSLQFTGSTNTGLSAGTSNVLSLSTNGAERLKIGSTGTITIDGLSGSAGILHSDVSGNLSSSLIVNSDIDPTAAIADTKLATISTTGKVSNNATTAVATNTINTIVARDGSGNFSAGTITASLTGASSLNVLTSGGIMTGSLTLPAGLTTAPSLQFTGSTNTGLSASTANVLSLSTNGAESVQIGATGIVKINGLSTNGVVHNNSSGVLSTSLITNADIDSAAAIADTKLATISTTGKVSNNATTAVATNTINTIVARDGSGNFSAGTITASLAGASSLNVLKAGDAMTGSLTLPNSSTASPALNFSGALTTGLSGSSAGALSLLTSNIARLTASSSGTIAIANLSTTGVVHNDSLGNLTTSLIMTGDIDPSLSLSNSNLATITTSGKVSNTATTATISNTPNTIVLRDGSGGFNAGMITASLTGALTGASSLNVLKTGDTMTGALTLPNGSTSLPALSFNGITGTGVSAISNILSISTNGVENLKIGSAGEITMKGLVTGTSGVLHCDATLGSITNSLIVNSDITNTTITDAKLATIATALKVSNTATTATNLNTASAIVSRDVSGNFTASTITASLTGASSLNVLKTGDTMTGALTLPNGSTSLPALSFNGITGTGVSAISNILSISTNGVENLKIGSAGEITMKGLVTGTSGVLHCDATLGSITNSLIVNSDITNTTITDAKLATIATALKVSNTATTATNLNTASAIVSRDTSGNFLAGTITASLIGASSLNVLKTGDTMTGALTLPNSSTTTPALNFSGALTTGISATSTNTLSLITANVERLKIDNVGTVTMSGLGGTAGVVHSDASGNLTNTQIFNSDISALAAISDSKLATIATINKVSNSATTATSANTGGTIVARDGLGSFAAGTITASLTGASSLNVLKTGDTMTGQLIINPSAVGLAINGSNTTSTAMTVTGGTSSGVGIAVNTSSGTGTGLTINTAGGVNAIVVNPSVPKFTVAGTTGLTTIASNTVQFNNGGTNPLNAIGCVSSLAGQRMLFGSATTTTAITSGSGFTYVDGTAGAGTINFTNAYSATPYCVITVLPTTAGQHVFAHLTAISTTSFAFAIFRDTGTAADGTANFMVMGSVA